MLLGVNHVRQIPLISNLRNLEDYNLLVQIRNLPDLTGLIPVLSDPRLKQLILQTQLNPIELIKQYKELTARPLKVYMHMPHYSWLTPIRNLPGLLYVYYPDTNQMYYWTLDQTTEQFINNDSRFDELEAKKIHWIFNPTFQEEIFENMKMGLQNPRQPPSDNNPDMKSLASIRDHNWSLEYLNAYDLPIVLNNWEVTIVEDHSGRPLLTTVNPVERRTLDHFRFPESYEYEHENNGETEDEDKLTVSFNSYEYRTSKMVDFLNQNHPWTIFDLLLFKDPRHRLNHSELRKIGKNYQDLTMNGGTWYTVDGKKKVLE